MQQQQVNLIDLYKKFCLYLIIIRCRKLYNNIMIKIFNTTTTYLKICEYIY